MINQTVKLVIPNPSKSLPSSTLLEDHNLEKKVNVFHLKTENLAKDGLNKLLITNKAFFTQIVVWKGGAAQHRGSILASHPAATGSILGAPNNFSLHVAEIY